MGARPRIVLLVLGAIGAGLTALVMSCGAFNGTSDPRDVVDGSNDAGTESSTPESGAGDDGGNDGATVDAGNGGAFDASIDASSAKIIFVTSQRYAGNALGGLKGADGICASRASLGAVNVRGKTWKAYLSVPGTNAKDNVLSDMITYVRVDGATIGRKPDLAGPMGTLEAPVDVNETNDSIASARAWTGSKTDGTADNGNTCGGWMAATGAGVGNGAAGDVTATTDGGWETSPPVTSCDTFIRLYCVQQ